MCTLGATRNNVKHKKKKRKRREIQAGDVSVLKLPKKSPENNLKTRNRKLHCRTHHEKCDLFELSIHRINYVYIYISGLLWLKKKNPNIPKMQEELLKYTMEIMFSPSPKELRLFIISHPCDVFRPADPSALCLWGQMGSFVLF